MNKLLIALFCFGLAACETMQEIEKPAASQEEIRKDGTKVTTVDQMEVALGRIMLQMAAAQRHKITCTAGCEVDLYAGSNAVVNLQPPPKPLPAKHGAAQFMDSLAGFAASVVMPLVGGDVLKTGFTQMAGLGTILGRAIQAPAGTSITVTGSQGVGVGGTGAYSTSDVRNRTDTRTFTDNSQNWALSILCSFYSQNGGTLPSYCTQR